MNVGRPHAAPGAGTGMLQGTQALAINQDGGTTGSAIDNNNVVHGFVRGTTGQIIAFDVPGTGTITGEGTFAQAINDGGTIAGY